MQRPPRQAIPKAKEPNVKIYNYVYDDENRLIEMRTDTYYTAAANRWKTEWIYDGLGRVRVRKEYIWYDAYQWYLLRTFLTAYFRRNWHRMDFGGLAGVPS